MMAEQRELIKSLVREKSGEHAKPRDDHRTPVKLRTEGMPHWPSRQQGTSYPFFLYGEDFLAWIKPLGLYEVLDPDSVTTISPASDALALRYVIASMTNPTISTHLASTYNSGRVAWQYLNDSFGLKSLGQSVLRESIRELRITVQDDPRVLIMLMERMCKRLDPPMTSKELSEHLIEKLPHAWQHIGTSIECMTDMSDFPRVKEKFIDLVTKLRRVEARKLIDNPGGRSREAYNVNASLLGTGTPSTATNLEQENYQLRKSLMKTNGRVGGKRATFNKKKFDNGRPQQRSGQRPKDAAKWSKKDERRPDKRFNDRKPADTNKKTMVCVRCGEHGHMRKDCTKPVTRCTHPACGQDHLRKFCFWEHPERIQNASMRRMWEQRIAKHNKGKEAYKAEHKDHHESDDTESYEAFAVHMRPSCLPRNDDYYSPFQEAKASYDHGHMLSESNTQTTPRRQSRQ